MDPSTGCEPPENRARAGRRGYAPAAGEAREGEWMGVDLAGAWRAGLRERPRCLRQASRCSP